MRRFSNNTVPCTSVKDLRNKRGSFAALIVVLLAGIACGKAVDRQRIPVEQSLVFGSTQYVQAQFVDGTEAEAIAALHLAGGTFSFWVEKSSSLALTEVATSATSANTTSVTDGTSVAASFGTWVSYDVAPAGVTLSALDAVYSDGTYYIAAVDRTHQDLWFGRGSLSSIAWENVYPGFDVVAARPSVVLDPLGNPAVAFANQTSGEVQLARYNPIANTWGFEAVAQADVETLELHVDSAGAMNVVWSGVQQQEGLFFSRRFEGQWTTQLVWSGRVGALDFALVPLDASDLQNTYPRVAFQEDGLGALHYADLATGNTWTIETIDRNHGAGSAVRMTLDADNQVRIVYLNFDLLQLDYARSVEGGWLLGTLDGRGNTAASGFWPDVAIAADGTASVLFYSVSGAGLYVAPWRDF